MAAPDDDTTQPQPAAPAPGSMSGYLSDPTVQALLRQITNPAPPQLPAPPARVSSDGTRPGWLSLLGEGLGGGQSPLYHLSGSAEDSAGARSLLNFGVGMLMASGPQRVRPGLGQIFGSGLQAAQESMNQSQQAAYTQAGQQFAQQKDLATLGLEQQKARIEQLNAILPLLRLQTMQNQPPLYGGGTGGTTPGQPLSTSAPLTGDITKDQAIIAQRESGGDPTALNYVAKADPTAYDRGATASGKYQFVNSTWKEGLQLAGIDPKLQTTRAMDAPESVQDQVFKAVYGKYGTAPWDPSKWAKNWVQGADGKYTLQTAPYQPPPGASSKAPPTQAAGAPPPYKVATTGPTPPPPSSAAPAPATGSPFQATTPATSTAPENTPDQKLAIARAQAKDSGQPVPLAGGNGLVVYPNGNVGPPPGGGGLATQPAPGAKVVAPQPQPPASAATPPGVVTTPPAPAPAPTPTTNPPAVVAPQPATQADQPPAQPPAVDLKSRPDTELNAEQFIQKHWVPLTPDQVKTYAPGPDGQVAAAAADQVQRAKQQVTAAETQLNQIRGGILPGDVNKAQGQVNDANKELDAAENNYNTTVRSLQSDGAKNLLAADDQQRQQLRADYKASVLDPRNKAAELTQQGQQQIALERVKTQSQAEGKVLDSLNETGNAAREALNQVDLARSLSRASGDPTFWQMVQKSHPEMVKWLGNAGALPDETVKQLGTADAMDAAFNKLITMARFGTGFSRPTNLDVQILTSQAPTSTDPQAWREAKLAYMQTYMQHEQDYVDRVHSLAANPRVSLSDAQRQARAEQPPIVPQMDWATANDVDARKAWPAANGVAPNTFFRAPDGQLIIYTGR